MGALRRTFGIVTTSYWVSQIVDKKLRHWSKVSECNPLLCTSGMKHRNTKLENWSVGTYLGNDRDFLKSLLFLNFWAVSG